MPTIQTFYYEPIDGEDSALTVHLSFANVIVLMEVVELVVDPAGLFEAFVEYDDDLLDEEA